MMTFVLIHKVRDAKHLMLVAHTHIHTQPGDAMPFEWVNKL